MAVTGADLHWYRAAGGDSEGGALSALEIDTNTDNNLFPDIGEVSALAGGSMTRKLFLRNEHGVDGYPPHSIWILTDPSESQGEIGLGFNDAEDDDLTLGALVNLAAPGLVALKSNGTDTRTATVCGVDTLGAPLWEDVVLDGANEVLTTEPFQDAYSVHLGAVSASRTVSVLDGSGGTSMGTIGPGAVNLFRWITATAKATGLLLPVLAPGVAHGVQLRVTWSAGAGAVDANAMDLKTQKL